MTGRGTIVVTFPAFVAGDRAHAGVLADAGLNVRVAPKRGVRSTQEVVELMADAVGAVVSTDPFDSSVFAGCPHLRVVARVGVGFDSIDLDAATEAGVIVTTTPGLNIEAVADHTLALMLASLRRITQSDTSVRAGRWERGAADTSWELHRAMVGIIGFGAIGQAVARRLVGFDCTVLAYDLEPRSVGGRRGRLARGAADPIGCAHDSRAAHRLDAGVDRSGRARADEA